MTQAAAASPGAKGAAGGPVTVTLPDGTVVLRFPGQVRVRMLLDDFGSAGLDAWMPALDQAMDGSAQRLVIERRVLAQHVRHQHHEIVEPALARGALDDRDRVHEIQLVAGVGLAGEVRLGHAAEQRAALEVHRGVVQGRRGRVADAPLGLVEQPLEEARGELVDQFAALAPRKWIHVVETDAVSPGARVTLDLACREPLHRSGPATPPFLREQMDALALVAAHQESEFPALLGHALALVPASTPTFVVATRAIDWEALAASAAERGAELAGRRLSGINVAGDELAKVFHSQPRDSQ